MEVGGVNPEGVAVVDQQSGVNNNDGLFEKDEMPAAGTSLDMNFLSYGIVPRKL